MNEGYDPRSRSFWMWVTQHLDEIRSRAGDPNSDVFEEMVRLLHQYDPLLGVEIAVEEPGDVEVVVTAYGERSRFESVLRLVAACPVASGFKAVAFRQPAAMDFSLSIDDREFSPANVWFEPMKGIEDPKSVGLTIFFPDADNVPREQRLQIAHVMLQAVLGEYQSSLRVDHVEVADSAGIDLEKYIQLANVGAYLSWFEKRSSQ
jgi:hypothetical protein